MVTNSKWPVMKVVTTCANLRHPKILFFLPCLLVLLSCNPTNAVNQPTTDLIICLQAYREYDSRSKCDNYVVTLNELLSRIDEPESIAEIIAHEVGGGYAQQDHLNLMAILYLNEKASSAIPVFDKNIGAIDNTEELVSTHYIYYQLFFLGVMGEDAVCALPNVHRITQFMPEVENSISHVPYQNLAYWVIEQLLGESRRFSLPSDANSESYGEWTTDKSLLSQQHENDIVDSFQIYIDTRIFTIAEERNYFYIHHPEDNAIIERWWQEEGKYLEWNSCAQD
jgi:hypothetical protein